LTKLAVKFCREIWPWVVRKEKLRNKRKRKAEAAEVTTTKGGVYLDETTKFVNP
jgi:hypothetical protein